MLSASKGHWIDYDDAKMRQTFDSAMQAARGTDLHNLAAEHIRLGVKMPGNRQTINAYVNDAIGFRMSPEVVLRASDIAFGTADAIGFRNEYNPNTNEEEPVLRVFDLKTGTTRTTFRQLLIYAAYFCIEYRVDPYRINVVLRIYQNDEYKEEIPEASRIFDVMKKTLHNTELVEKMQEEAMA